MTFFDVLTHLFLPHESNNHRARLLHPHAYLFYIVFFVFFGMGLKFVHKYAPNILGVATNISVSDLLSSTNQKRAEAGLTPLTLNDQLSQAASNKAFDMFKDNYWAHFGPNGSSPWDFINKSGYHYTFAGENLAKDFNDSSSVVSAWMASSSHRSNLLKPEYKDIGFAVINGTLNGQETTLVVQMFGSSPSSGVVATKTMEIVPKEQSINISSNTRSAETTPTPVIFVAGVRKVPLIDLPTLNKIISLLLLVLLTVVLTLDGLVIWQRKTVRISGHNIAHIIFIVGLIAAIWLTTQGSIL